MKKILLLLCVAGVILSFAACADKKDEDITPDNNENEIIEQDEKENEVADTKDETETVKQEQTTEKTDEPEKTEETNIPEETSKDEQNKTPEIKEDEKKEAPEKTEGTNLSQESARVDGLCFEGFWVTDSSQYSAAEIRMIGSGIYRIVGRVYSSSNEYIQYECEALNEIDENGQNTLRILVCDSYDIAEIDVGIVEIEKLPFSMGDMYMIYNSFEESEYCTWFFSEDKNIAFVRADSYPVDLLRVEEMRN